MMLNSLRWNKILALVHLGKPLVLDLNVILSYARWDGPSSSGQTKKDASLAQLNPKRGTKTSSTLTKNRFSCLHQAAWCRVVFRHLFSLFSLFRLSFLVRCSLLFDHFHFSAIMVHSTRHTRALRERSRSRDDSQEHQIPMWQPHPSTRANEFRESWQEVPRPEQHRDVLIFVCLKSIPDLMRQYHDNTMHWTSCDTLPLLGRQEEHCVVYLLSPAHQRTTGNLHGVQSSSHD